MMLFKQLFYSIRNYTSKIPTVPLGRWDWRHGNVDITTFLTNRDHCGDFICGDLKENKIYIEKFLKKKVQK
jgi:hypothetical protein